MKIKHLPFLFLGILTSCGYALQHSANPRLEQEGIERVYIRNIVNDSEKPGINTTVYNSLIKVIQKNKRVKLAHSPESADAIIEATVTSANYAVSAITSASQLNPKNTFEGVKNVATEYRARLTCKFALKKLAKRNPKELINVWSGVFDREKPFPGNAQVGVLGKTTGLINDSEFDRALFDLSELMMDDVHEMMLAMF